METDFTVISMSLQAISVLIEAGMKLIFSTTIECKNCAGGFNFNFEASEYNKNKADIINSFLL